MDSPALLTLRDEVAVPVESTIPEYEGMLKSYHEAFSTELQAMIAGLPIVGGNRVLDMACGDGVYSAWIARHVGARGRVVAVDLLPAYLDLARRSVANGPCPDRISLVGAAIEHLPFADGTFDVVWCAQSLFSLPEPVAALAQLCRVTKPGGVVAVLENDSMHQVILPWPVEIELEVRRAELASFVETSDHPRKYYVARRLPQTFRAAGLEDCHARTWATDRRGPLSGPTRSFFQAYLRQLQERVTPHLTSSVRTIFDQLVNPDSGGCLLDDPDLNVTYVDHVVWGRRPF